MGKNSYQRIINVHATAIEATNKIGKVDKWWAKKVRGKSEMLNDRFTVDFGETFVDFQITELVPGKRVVWKVTDCHLHWITNKKEWINTEVVFDITGKKDSTQIHFTHAGLVPGAECYSDCEAGWDEHIKQSLVRFINEGAGMPM